ncbi:MAG: helix-turn-helix transcriptional regulator [Dehalococcoidales bacterium]|nr:helix-turn-helix transcriptional regulator [Dehalococcoidales bacterium]
MSTKKTRKESITGILNEILQRKRLRPRQLADKLGVSHASVSRWLSGKDIPSASSCQKIAEFAGISLEKILYVSGQIPYRAYINIELPAFREYARQKYPNELDEDIITMIEHLIELRSLRTGGKKHK